MARKDTEQYQSYEKDAFDNPPEGPVGVHRGTARIRFRKASGSASPQPTSTRPPWRFATTARRGPTRSPSACAQPGSISSLRGLVCAVLMVPL